jgi:hypothetical protein
MMAQRWPGGKWARAPNPTGDVVDVLGGLNLAAAVPLVAVNGLLVGSHAPSLLARRAARPVDGGVPHPVLSAAEGIPGWGFDEDFAG